MAKTIVFKKEFEDKLKKLKIKTKFLKNLTVESVNSNTSKDFKTIEDVVKHLNSRANWERFLVESFSWWHSNEGADYWRDFHNK
jgi:hypothetical protein